MFKIIFSIVFFPSICFSQITSTEDIRSNIQSFISWELIAFLISLAIVYAAGTMGRRYIDNLISRKRFKDSETLGVGSIVCIGHATGAHIVQLVKVSKNTLTFQNREVTIEYPIEDYMNGQRTIKRFYLDSENKGQTKLDLEMLSDSVYSKIEDRIKELVDKENLKNEIRES